MKRVKKGKEPASLLTYRKQPQASYEDYRERDDLRESLLEEQGYICCYCMQRINKENLKIEHWKPQSKYPELQLISHNLLAACDGNEGSSPKFQHCDTHKGDDEITLNPADSQKNCEQYIKYSSDGRIDSDDPIINYELNEILNLNTQTLVSNRNKKIQAYEGKENGKYKPYCKMIVYFLRKRFAKELGNS